MPLSSTRQTPERLRRVLREVKALALLDSKYVVGYKGAWLERRDPSAPCPLSLNQDDSAEGIGSELSTSSSSCLSRGCSDDAATLSAGESCGSSCGECCGNDDELSENLHGPSLDPDAVGCFEWERGISPCDAASQHANPSLSPGPAGGGVSHNRSKSSSVKHDLILYIQMAYCTSSTLRDFLRSRRVGLFFHCKSY